MTLCAGSDAEAIRRLQGAQDLLTVQQIVRAAARRAARADGATFVLRDVDHCFYADEDAMSPLWKGQRFPLTNCISGWAMLHAETVVVPDITRDARVPLEAYRPTFVKSLAMVPVGSDKPVAAIGAYWAHVHEATHEEIRALETLARATGAALKRIGLFDAPSLPTFRPEHGYGTLDPTDLPPAATSTEDHERIARDLHDTVLQRMFGAGLILHGVAEGVDDPATSTSINEALEQIDESIRELRGVIFGLDYGHRDLGGLQGEVLAVVAECSRSLGFRPEVAFSGSLEAVNADIAREARMALREMLSNVSRHAAARQVWVRVHSGSSLTVIVEDDGKGIGPRPARGSGLGNLEARAQALGGGFELAPRDGGGTVARWSVVL